jgi:thioredoxin reductase
VVGVRIAGDERAPGGMGPTDAGALAADLEAEGLVDYVNVSTGAAAAPGWIVLDATFGRLANVDAARVVRSMTSLPVLMAGRVAEPAEAEEVLASGAADMVGVVRALIADPRWLAKGIAGETGSIRPCTYCNECIAGIGAFRPIRCSVNPEMGHEAEAEAARAAGPPPRRRVVVVGGGLAGLEAATSAAALGHDVVLLERSGSLGGQAVLAPEVGMRPEAVRIGHHLAALAAGEARVDVRLGTEATPDAVLALAPDVVVVATGSAVRASSLPGAAHAVDALAVLEGAVDVGHRVLVCQDGGSPWELEVVLEHLARHGHDVTAVVPGPMVTSRGTDVGVGARLVRAGVDVQAWRVVTALSADGASTRHVVTGEVAHLDGFDAVVLAGTRTACDALAGALRGRGPHVVAIGDALAPRQLRDAVHEGRAAALAIA